MEKNFKNCQSCGMPLKKDPRGGGTTAEGNLSVKYCSYCYEKGAFKQPDWAAAQMLEFVKGKLKEMGFHKFLRAFLQGVFQNLNVGKNKLIKKRLLLV